jgi:hypothetical protein
VETKFDQGGSSLSGQPQKQFGQAIEVTPAEARSPLMRRHTTSRSGFEGEAHAQSTRGIHTLRVLLWQLGHIHLR